MVEATIWLFVLFFFLLIFFLLVLEKGQRVIYLEELLGSDLSVRVGSHSEGGDMAASGDGDVT